MAKRARRRSSASTTASSDVEETDTESATAVKKLRVGPEPSSSNAVNRTNTENDGKVQGREGDSASTEQATKSIKIFNLNVNGVLKAFARKNKRLGELLIEQGGVSRVEQFTRP